MAAHVAIDGDIATIGPQHSRVREIAADHKPAIAYRRKRSGVDDRVGAGVDDKGIGASGVDLAVVDQDQLPVPELAGTGKDVVDIGQGDVGTYAADDVLCAVGQDHVTAAPQRSPVSSQPKVGLIAG